MRKLCLLTKGRFGRKAQPSGALLRSPPARSRFSGCQKSQAPSPRPRTTDPRVLLHLLGELLFDWFGGTNQRKLGKLFLVGLEEQTQGSRKPSFGGSLFGWFGRTNKRKSLAKAPPRDFTSLAVPGAGHRVCRKQTASRDFRRGGAGLAASQRNEEMR